MKVVTNTRIDRAGYHVYRMCRVIGKQQMGLDVAVTRYEREHCRPVVAMRLKHARNLLSQSMQICNPFRRRF